MHDIDTSPPADDISMSDSTATPQNEVDSPPSPRRAGPTAAQVFQSAATESDICRWLFEVSLTRENTERHLRVPTGAGGRPASPSPSLESLWNLYDLRPEARPTNLTAIRTRPGDSWPFQPRRDAREAGIPSSGSVPVRQGDHSSSRLNGSLPVEYTRPDRQPSRSGILTYRPTSDAEDSDLPPPYTPFEVREHLIRSQELAFIRERAPSYLRADSNRLRERDSSGNLSTNRGRSDRDDLRGTSGKATAPSMKSRLGVVGSKVRKGVKTAKNKVCALSETTQKLRSGWQTARAKGKLEWLEKNGYLDDEERLRRDLVPS